MQSRPRRTGAPDATTVARWPIVAIGLSPKRSLDVRSSDRERDREEPGGHRAKTGRSRRDYDVALPTHALRGLFGPIQSRPPKSDRVPEA